MSLAGVKCSVPDEGELIATEQQKEMKMLMKGKIKRKVCMLYEILIFLG
jgi:hypothetical protein